jgi:zinc protease
MGATPARRVLDNGLAVVAEARGLGPVVFAGVVYRVGSRDERPGITGISHLLEHMMFKGTEKFAKGEVAAIVERNGGDLNAFTSEDVTMYYEVFARDRWEMALTIESERMVNLRIDPAELESERQVVLEERTMYRDIPVVEMSEELSAAVLRESPYRWPIIGWDADIRAITRDDLVEHYRRYYAPNNATLVVVGDVEPDEVFAAAERHFGAVPAGTPFERRVPREPEFRGATRLHLDAPVNLPYYQLVVRAPEMRTRDAEVLYLLSSLLSGTRTSRLDMALLETNRAGDVHVSFHAKADPGTLSIVVEGKDADGLRDLEEIVWRELGELAEKGPDGDELERALNQAEAHQLFAMQSPSNRGFALGWHDAHGDVTYADRIVERLRTVTPDEMRDVARRIFRRDRCGTGTIAAAGSGNGGAGGRAAVAAETVHWAPAGRGPAAPGLSGPTCPRRRFRTGLQAAPGMTRTVLDNGMTVTLQRDRTDPVVSVSLLFHGGAVLDPDDRAGRASVAADTLERGSASKGFPDFARAFETIGSEFSLAAGAELVHANSTFLSRHAVTGLSLVCDLLEDPGYREEDFAIVRALAQGDLDAREDDLDDLVDDLFFRAVAQGHPLARLPHGTAEGLAALTHADVVAAHAESFRPDRAHLAVVGDFDEAGLSRLLTERFGRLPGPGGPRAELSPMNAARVERQHVLSRADKGQVKIVFGGPGLSATDEERLAGVAMNHILGGSAIRSRLGDEIRDKQGLAYSVSSRNYERSAGGFFLVSMGTRPGNVRGAVASIRAELARITEGVTDTELEEAKAYLTGSFPLRFATYGHLSRYWSRNSFHGRPTDDLQTYVDRVRALTADDLKRVAERLVASAGTLAVAGAVDGELAPLAPESNG